MIHTNISHRSIYDGIITDFSSELDENHSVKNILREEGYWSNEEDESITSEYFIIDYQETLPINFIEISPAESSNNAFPSDFRIEGSIDGINWMIIHSEKKFSLKDTTYKLELSIIHLRYLKIIIFKSQKTGDKYHVAIGRLQAGISGIKTISPSSPSYPDHDIYKLLDRNRDTYWETNLKPILEREIVDIDLGNVFLINNISLISTSLKSHGFPENFSIEISTDRSVWTMLFEEKNFISEPSKRYYWEFPTSPARFIRIEMLAAEIEHKQFGIRLAEIEITAASINHSHTHNIGNLTPYASIFNAGIIKLSKDGEDKHGTVIQASDSRLKDASTRFKGVVQLAEDGDASEGLVVQASDQRLKPASDLNFGIVRFAYDREDNPATAVQGNDSRLKEATENSFGIVKLCPDNIYSEMGVVKGNDSRLRKATDSSFGICRIAKDGEINPNCVVAGSDRRLRDATTTYKGIVELAEDGEDSPGVAVQGNDKRLKNATTTTKGIVELAEDGEDSPGIAVQGNDKRLKNATTITKGIVELAEDGEDSLGVAVQGNDKRLKNATTTYSGIVMLAKNGQDSPGVAVQGNDKRLKNATETRKGILIFAKDGETSPLTAVQASDRRLRDATTTYKGIVELAEDGEDSPDVAVQGNDKRLKNATTSAKGIVELAEDGEDSPGVVVQGNDKRLKNATVEKAGIIKLAKKGETRKGQAVQSDDPRLSDSRKPLSHSHNYAPLDHDYNSHRGTLSIIDNTSESFTGIVPPTDNSAIMYAKNQSRKKGATGIIGITEHHSKQSTHCYGVVGHSQFIGVRGQSSGNSDTSPRGCGILGISRFGAGGVFSSEHGPSLVADGYGTISEFDDTLSLIGDGNALVVKGRSEFIGAMFIGKGDKDNSFPDNLVELFQVEDDEYISPGDVLVASDKGNAILARSRSKFNKSVIGIVSGNPTVILNSTREEEKLYPVTLAGKTLCRVDARENPIKPGDLIVTSETPGCGMAGRIDSFDKIGTVIGKALDSLEEGIGIIAVFVTHL
jgi:hypothetical protein